MSPKQLTLRVDEQPSKIDPAQKLSICLREDDTTVEAKVDVDGDADRPPVIIPLFRLHHNSFE